MTRLQALQRRIEDGAILDGIKRSKEQTKKARAKAREGFTQEGLAFARRIMKEMVPLYHAEMTSGRRTTLEPLKRLSAETVCVVACQAALHRVSRGEEKATRTCERIGRALEDLLPQRKRPARKWRQQRAIKIGSRFVDYLKRIGIFEEVWIPVRRSGKPMKPARGVVPTAATLDTVDALAAFLAAGRPVSPPCVVVPVPWKGTSGGGYHYRTLPLVRRASKEHLSQLDRAIEMGELRPVFASLNALQTVAWHINGNVYDIAKRLVAAGVGPVLRRPPSRPAISSAEKRALKRSASKFIGQQLAMGVAEANRHHGRIYFPHNLDNRGRIYPVVDFLSPHGTDLQRGLLEFARGDAMTGDAPRWLRVHLANCYGKDKMSFDRREQWSQRNERMILACARKPLADARWHNADKPWQFLAACFAWADYRAKGKASICRLPVMLDGSCSAFQHYAAALRDEQVAPLVNLVQQETPGDLYAAVTKRVRKSAKRDASLQIWRDKVDRSTVKRAVMVEPYGASHLSRLRYIQEQLEEDDEQEMADEIAALFETEEESFVALGALTRAVRAGTLCVAGRPLKAMAWIRKLVGAWAKHSPDRPFGWTAPSGLPVVSPYYRTVQDKEVKAKLDGLPIYLGTRRLTDEVNWRKTATAAAPNFIHSLDASHLALSVVAAKRKGVTQLCAVHDAFGTTPARTETLLNVLRSEFAKLYAQDPFNILASAAAGVGVQFNEPLERGKLDPKVIAKATYLFA